jgi:hypothetical protein
VREPSPKSNAADAPPPIVRLDHENEGESTLEPTATTTVRGLLRTHAKHGFRQERVTSIRSCEVAGLTALRVGGVASRSDPPRVQLTAETLSVSQGCTALQVTAYVYSSDVIGPAEPQTLVDATLGSVTVGATPTPSGQGSHDASG